MCNDTAMQGALWDLVEGREGTGEGVLEEVMLHSSPEG